jgi:hypothetical protein
MTLFRALLVGGQSTGYKSEKEKGAVLALAAQLVKTFSVFLLLVL